MAQALDGIASDRDQLSDRVRELERRVSALEGHPEIESPAPPASGSVARRESWPSEPGRGFPTTNLPGGALPVFGRAVLGIAGAYLLRAVAESGTVAKLPLLIVAIVYAGMWLVWAFRAHATNRFASGTYAITAALILSPLLWESTVRVQVLSPVFTAAVLVAFLEPATVFGCGCFLTLSIITEPPGCCAYVAIALGALKLLLEDLRFGNSASLVASLLFYGLILILIPRLTRFGSDRS